MFPAPDRAPDRPCGLCEAHSGRFFQSVAGLRDEKRRNSGAESALLRLIGRVQPLILSAVTLDTPCHPARSRTVYA